MSLEVMAHSIGDVAGTPLDRKQSILIGACKAKEAKVLAPDDISRLIYQTRAFCRMFVNSERWLIRLWSTPKMLPQNTTSSNHPSYKSSLGWIAYRRNRCARSFLNRRISEQLASRDKQTKQLDKSVFSSGN
jgi:hypothetical protein